MPSRTAHGALTLPGDYYTSDEIFGREQERIFSRHWLYSGHTSRLREVGSYYRQTLDGDSVIIVRDRDDEIRAFFNVCRHRGTQLCERDEGRFEGGIQCPYHAWTYRLDGSLRAAPNMAQVSGFDVLDYPLHPVRVAVLDGLIFVSLKPQLPALADYLEPLAGQLAACSLAALEAVHSTDYDVAANWKLLFQNYSECYHCPTVHPLLNRLTPYRDSSNDLDEGPLLGGPMALAPGCDSMTMTGRACAAPLGSIAGDSARQVYYYTIFPNLFLSLHPDYVLVHRSEPLAADRTRIHCDWYFHPAATAQPDFDPSGAVEFWDMTNRQDWRLCALSQAGISSRAYSPGPYAELESQLAAFDRYYLQVMEGRS